MGTRLAAISFEQREVIVLNYDVYHHIAVNISGLPAI